MLDISDTTNTVPCCTQLVQEAQTVTQLVAHWRYYQRALVAKAKLESIGYIEGHVTPGKPPLPEDMKDQVRELFGVESTWANTTASVRFAFLPTRVFDLAKKLEIMYYEETLKGQRYAKSKADKKGKEEKEKDEDEDDEEAGGRRALGKRKKKKKTALVPRRPANLLPIRRNFFEALATNLGEEDAYQTCLKIVIKESSLEVIYVTRITYVSHTVVTDRRHTNTSRLFAK